MKDKQIRCAQTDMVRIHYQGRKYFKSKPVKNTDLVSFEAAKKFALFVLYTHLVNLDSYDAR